MTETMPEQTENWGDVERSADAMYPEYPANPHNHPFTISIDTRGPHLAIRGNTAQEIADRYAEAESIGLTALLAGIWSHMKAEFQMAGGAGPVTPVPAAGAPVPPPMPQAPQGAPTPPPFGPNVSVPGAPGYAGPPAPPALPVPPAQPQVQNAEYKQAGWYRLDVPFPKGKQQFDAICAQYQMRKGRPSEGGQFSFNSKGEKAWYVDPQYVGCFTQFSPVPA